MALRTSTLLLASVLGAACARPAPSPAPRRDLSGIRAIDFTQHRFETSCGHREPGPGSGDDEEWTLAVEHVQYGDLTGDRLEEAAVVVTCTTGGTAGPQPEIHVFAMRGRDVVRIGKLDGGGKYFGPEDVTLADGTLRIVRSFQGGNEMPLEEEVETLRWDGKALARVTITPRRQVPVGR